jgi:hypothetical protein
VPKFIIEVYVCPTCGNYYGASSAGNLAQKVASADKGKKLLPRDRCPGCEDTRVPCVFEIELTPKEPEQEVLAETE